MSDIRREAAAATNAGLAYPELDAKLTALAADFKATVVADLEHTGADPHAGDPDADEDEAPAIPDTAALARPCALATVRERARATWSAHRRPARTEDVTRVRDQPTPYTDPSDVIRRRAAACLLAGAVLTTAGCGASPSTSLSDGRAARWHDTIAGIRSADRPQALARWRGSRATSRVMPRPDSSRRPTRRR